MCGYWIIGIIITIIFIIFVGDWVEEKVAVAFVSMFILAGIYMIVILNQPYEVIETYEEKQYDIQGLENNIETEKIAKSGFVLGVGFASASETQNMKYYYFKVLDFGKQLETLEIGQHSDTYIRETDEMTPCLLKRYETRKKKENKFFGVKSNSYNVSKETILVVPTNTIKIDYNIEI